jgi:DNA-binding NarL/FixJ family response regulator
MKNVLIVDDHPMVVEIMGAYARTLFPDAKVETANALAQAIDCARTAENLDLVLLDLRLPDCEGITALTRFREAFPAVPTVVVSATEDRAVVMEALNAGAAGYIPKTSSPPVVMAALRLVAAGGTYVPPQVLQAKDPGSAHEGDGELTERERDVLRLMVRGFGNKEIAQDLHIAPDTVKNHARAIYAALGIASRADAARAVERRGIKLG